MSRVAWIGTGLMGLPMAARVVAAGHRVTVWNRTLSRAKPLAVRGAEIASTPAEAVRGAEVVITMLAGPDALKSVLIGDSGMASAMSADAVLIEMSTVGPAAVREAVTVLPKGAQVLDAPVLGSVPQALEGTLRIFVGGEPDIYERWAGLLSAIGDPNYVGPSGSGAAMKLVVNSTLVALMSTLAEALSLADALALDQRRVLDMLADSPIGTTVRSKRDHLDSGRYPPRFRLELAAKDARLAVEAAEGHGRDPRIARAARSWLEDAVKSGYGDLDYSAVIAHVRGRKPLA